MNRCVKGLGIEADKRTLDATFDALDNQEMYAGCNTLRLGFSNLTEITVKHNNERSWNYRMNGMPPRFDAAASLILQRVRWELRARRSCPKFGVGVAASAERADRHVLLAPPPPGGELGGLGGARPRHLPGNQSNENVGLGVGARPRRV